MLYSFSISETTLYKIFNLMKPKQQNRQVHFTYNDYSATQSVSGFSRITYTSDRSSRAGSSAGKTHHLNRIDPKPKFNFNGNRGRVDSAYNQAPAVKSPKPANTQEKDNYGLLDERTKKLLQKIEKRDKSPHIPNIIKPIRQVPDQKQEKVRKVVSSNSAMKSNFATEPQTQACEGNERSKKEEEDQILNSLTYNSIKPVIGWKKYIVLCGMDHGDNIDGCHCSKPCQWAENWTKSYLPKNKKPYQKLLVESSAPANLQQIDKDLHRTYPQCPTFSCNPEFRHKLRNILLAYSIYDSEVGYVQGMNVVAGALLYHIKSEDQTFWALVELMDEQELRLIYLSGFQVLKKHIKSITTLISKKLRDLYSHMAEMQITPEIFLYGWILSLMSNCIPLEYMHLVIDQFRTRGWIFIYQLVVTYLAYIKQSLLLAEDTAELLTYLNNDSAKEVGLDWQEMITNCYKVGQ